MSPRKVTELANRPQRPRSQCPTCNPRPDEIRADRLWEWSLAHPGVPVFR